MANGPCSADSRCGCEAKGLTSLGGVAPAASGMPVTATVCSNHQLMVLKVSDSGAVLVWPSVSIAMVTLAVGAEASRTK